jgi:autotransporter-associated beta strand protein
MFRAFGKDASRFAPASALALFVWLAFFAHRSTQAAFITWNGFGSDWGTGADWTANNNSGNLPALGDVAEFGNAVGSGAYSAFGSGNGYTLVQPNVSGTQTVGGLQVDNGSPASVVTIGGTGTLQLGSNGISIANGAGLNLNTSSISLQSPQSWTNNGVLGVAGNVDLGTNAANVLTLAGSGNTSIGGAISDAGGLAVNVAGGIVYLTNVNNSFTGGLSVQNGILNINTINNAGAAGVLGANSQVVLGSNGTTGTLEYTGAAAASTMNFNLAAAGSGAFQIDAAGNTLTIAGSLGGTGTLLKAGPGTLDLSNGANAYGNTVVNAGTLQSTAASGTPFGTGSITLNNGAIQISSGVVAAANAGVGTTFTYGDPNYGGGGFLAIDSRATAATLVTLGNASAAPSGVLVRAGLGSTLVIVPQDGFGALGNTDLLLVNGGVTAFATTSGAIVSPSIIGQNNDTSQSGAFLTYNTSFGFATATYSSSNLGGLSTTTTGALSLVNVSTTGKSANLASFGLTVSGATLTIHGGDSLTLGNSNNTNVATLILDNNAQIAPLVAAGGSLSFAAGVEGLIYVGGGNTITAPITGSSGITVFGPGTLTLQDTNAYTGGTRINGPATLAIGTSKELGAANTTTINGGTLEAAGTAQVNLAANQGLVIGPYGGNIYANGFGITLNSAGTISGSGLLNLAANGATYDALNISAAQNNWTGGVSLGNARLTLAGTNATLGSGPVTVTPSAEVLINSGNVTLVNPFLLGGGVGGEGRGLIDFRGAGSATLAGPIVLTAPSAGIEAEAGALNIAGNISGAYGIGYNIGTAGSGNAGLFLVTGTNTYAGATSIGSGTLAINSDQALGALGNALWMGVGVTGSGSATLEASNANVILNAGRTIYLANTGSVTQTFNTNGNSLTIAGSFAPSAGNVSVVGSGTLLLANTANQYSGFTSIGASLLQVLNLASGANPSSIGQSSNAASNLVFNGGTLQYLGAGSTTDRLFTVNANGGTLDASGTGPLQFDNTGSIATTAHATLTLAGTSVGNVFIPTLPVSANLVKAGNGAWILNSPNSYSGTTTVQQGTLLLGVNNALGSQSDVTVNSLLDLNGYSTSIDALLGSGTVDQQASGGNAVLTLGTRGGSGTFNGVIANTTGTTTVFVNGSGTVQFNNPNSTYSGGTSLNKGTLVIGANSNGSAGPLGSGPLYVDGNATFQGSGFTASPALTIGNTLQLLAGTPLTLTFGGSQNMNFAGNWGLGGTNKTFDVANSGVTVTFSQAVASQSSPNVGKTGPGTLVLSGSNDWGAHNLNANAGTLILPNSSAGLFDLNGVNVGDVAGSGGAMIQNGGGVTANNGGISIGETLGAYGYYQLNGGSASSTTGQGNVFIADNGIGVLDVNGGSINSNAMIFNASTGSSSMISQLNITGGIFNASSASSSLGLAIGSGAGGLQAQLNLMGGTLTTGNYAIYTPSGISAQTTTLNLLKSSTLQTVQIANNSPSGTFTLNFNGGTLKPTGSSTGFIGSAASGLTAAYVDGGNAIIDTSLATGPNTISQALLAPSGLGVNSATFAASGATYVGRPILVFSGGSGSGATGLVNVNPDGSLGSIQITNPGVGYLDGDTVAFSINGGGGSGATAGTVILGSVTGGGLQKLGAGTLILSNTGNTYTGATTVSGGNLAVTVLGNAGPATTLGGATNAPSGLVLDGGALQYIGSVAASTDRLFTLTSNGGALDASGAAGASLAFVNTGNMVFRDSAAAPLTLTGSNTGANTLAALVADNSSSLTATSLVKSGAGTWALTNSNTYSGGTSILQGILQATTLAPGGAASSIGASSNAASNLILSGGTLQYVGGPVTTNRLFTLAGFSTLDASAAGNAGLVFNNNGTVGASSAATLTLAGSSTGGNVFDPTLSGPLTLVKAGSGVWTLGSQNSYTGGTSVLKGNLSLGTNNAISSASSVYVASGATLGLNGFSNSIDGLSGTAGGTISQTHGNTATLAVGANGSSGSYGGLITDTSGTLNVTKLGTGVESLTGLNTYSGVTTISAGTLQVSTLASGGVASSIGKSSSAASNAIVDGGSLQYVGSGATTNRLFTLTTNGGVLDSSGPSGALQFTNGGAIALSGTGSRTFTLAGSNANTNFFQPILGDSGGPTGLVKSGAGAWSIGGANTYSGGTSVTAGTLQLAGASALPNASNLTVTGGLFELSSYSSSLASLNGNGGSIDSNAGNPTLTVNSGSYGGQLTGGLALAKASSGTLTLGGNNTYTGATAVNGGTLLLGSGAALGNTPVTVNSYATLANAGTATIGGALSLIAGTLAPGNGGIGALDLTSNLPLTLTSSSTVDFDIQPTGEGSLAIAGSLNLTGKPNIALATSGALSGPYIVATYATTSAVSTNSFNFVNPTPSGYTWVVKSTDLELDPLGAANSGDGSLLSLPVGTLTLNMHVSDTGTPGVTTVTNSASGTTGYFAPSSSGGSLAFSPAGTTSLTGVGTAVLNFGWASTALAGSRADTMVITNTGNSTDSLVHTQTVTGGVYRYANGTLSTTLNLGNFHVGATATGALSLTNAVPADGFSESLDASIGGATGSATTNGGSISLLAAGATDSASLVVGLNTSAAGALSGTAALTLYSDGSGTSGLGTTLLDGQMVNVHGNVYTGLSTWIAGSGGNWNSFGNWDTLGGTPGLDGILSRANDTATFGAGSGVVSLNGTCPEIKSLTFASSGGSYTIAQGTTTDVLHMSNGSGVATVSVVGSQTISAPVNLDSTTDVAVTNSTDVLTLSGNVFGVNGLIKDGAGLLSLTGTGSYSGGTSVNNGTVQLGSATAMIGHGGLYLTGGVVDLGGFGATIAGLNGTGGTVQGSAGSVLAVDSGTFAGLVTGAMGLAKESTGTLNLTGTANYTGPTIIDAGILNIVDQSGVPSSTSLTVNSILQLNGNSISVAGLSGSGTIASNTDPMLTVGSGSFSGILQGTMNLTKSGPGLLTLGNPNGNSYVGGTTISGGTLYVSNTSGSATGNGAVLVQNSGTLAGKGLVNVAGGSVTVAGGGTVYPGLDKGNTIEALSVNAVQFQPGSNLNIDVRGPVGSPSTDAYHDYLQVTGAGNLNVSNINLNLNLAQTGSQSLPQEYIRLVDVPNGASTGNLASLSVSNGISSPISFSNVPNNTEFMLVGNTLYTEAQYAADFGWGTPASDVSFWWLNYNVQAGSTTPGGEDIVLTNVPEPSTIAMMAGAAVMGLGGLAWRRKRSSINPLWARIPSRGNSPTSTPPHRVRRTISRRSSIGHTTAPDRDPHAETTGQAAGRRSGLPRL